VMEWKRNGVEKFFADHIKVLYFHKQYLQNGLDKFTRKDIKKYDIVITTYDLCSGICKQMGYHEDCYEIGDDHTLMKGKKIAVHLRTKKQSDNPSYRGASIIYGTPWSRVIVDESQRFANPKTHVFEAMMAIYGDYKWCLTGTPIRNKEDDIWAQFRFLGYNGIERATDWKKKYHSAMNDHSLRDCILSMSYKEAGVVLPPKTILPKYIELKDNNKKVYDAICGIMNEVYDEMLQKLTDYACVLAMFTKLRQCVIAPYLLTKASKRKMSPNDKKLENAVKAKLEAFNKSDLGIWCTKEKTEAGIKAPKILEIIENLKSVGPDEKVLIFSKFTSALDLVADAIKHFLPDLSFEHLDGDVVNEDRVRVMKAFDEDPSLRCLLISYTVGSEGLNLMKANHVIRIEPWWNNAIHDQGDSRTWRRGQEKEVFIHVPLVKDSIEDRIMGICRYKDDISDEIMEGTNKPIKKASTGLNKETLAQILGR